MEIFPFDDSIHMVYVTGKQLREMLMFMLRDEAFEGDHTEFYQLSEGLYLEYDKKSRSVLKFTFNNRNIKDDDMFTLALQKYHYLNIEGGFNISLKDLEANGKHRILATSCRDVLEEYLAENKHLDVDIKNNARLVIRNRK